MLERQDFVNGEMQVDTDGRESDVVDGRAVAADTNYHHRRAAEKHKAHTLRHQRRTKQKVVSDFATLSKGSSSGTKSRTALGRGLFSQGAPDKLESQLDLLKHKLETFAVQVSLKWIWKEESNGTVLENSWTDIVHSHPLMSKMQRHQQEALWEFVNTELIYINKLKIIKDLVMAALYSLNQDGFLLEVTPEQLFSNLPSILQAHQLFWQEVVYPMLRDVRQTGKPFDPIGLQEGCLQFHKRFSVYYDYCWEEENNLDFTRRQMESNPHFQTFIQWVETHPLGERMRLGDMQAKPHQRITKYPLLLKAVLEHSEEPGVQQALREMLSSVNGFLESINGYMQRKDDELALSISAQRVEGYEVEGINEEIDKYVQDINRFDLTCPIRGVGPDVVRKLLLEENLKVRFRKDQKLEVVALLFSDVLLLTKVQKRLEGLKVVRPPLALDRIVCTPLKDGCSFLVVEVGELQSIMNVLIFAAGTSQSCSTWISTIANAKDALKKLREHETIRLDKLRMQRGELKNFTEVTEEEMETVEQPLVDHEEEEGFPVELSDQIKLPTTNGVKHEEDQIYRESPTNSPVVQVSPQGIKNHKPVIKSQPTLGTDHEWIELKERIEGRGVWEEEQKVMETEISAEHTPTWSHQQQAVPYAHALTHSKDIHQFRYSSLRSFHRVIDELPDVDYPTDEESTLQFQRQYRIGGSMRPQRAVAWRSSKLDSGSQEINRNVLSSHSRDTQTQTSAAPFTKQLKSPDVQRRRLSSTNQTPPGQGSKQRAAASNTPSHSDTDFSQAFKRNSFPSNFGSERLSSSQTPKLGSLRSISMVSGSTPHKVLSDVQSSPRSDLSFTHRQNKQPRPRALRSSSIPNIAFDKEHEVHVPSDSLHPAFSAAERPRQPGNYDNENVSSVVGILERAKEREKETGGIRRERNQHPVYRSARYPSSQHVVLKITAPPPAPDPVEVKSEWKEVELMRPRALTVSKGWKEQLVDEDENEKGESVVFKDGVNVDWPGWCFDDDEVMNHLNPKDHRGEDVERFNRSVADWELDELEDGECSQV